VLSPLLDDNLSFFQAVEDFAVEQLVAQFCCDISAARQASGVDLPCAIDTSIWRSSVTICSALNLFFGMTNAPFQAHSLFANPLKIPVLIEGTTGGGGKLFELNVATGKIEFLLGISTPTLGINGAYLGPTIRCYAGDRVTLRVTNNLSEPTTLHWHGLHLPARYDGGPHQVVEPGAVWKPSFEIKQKASLCWYHSHLMGSTGEQVLRGLAGLFLIEDEESQSLHLPSEYGVDDIPLIIQDRRFNRDGSFDYLSAMPDAMMGYKGNVILVNGTVDPHFVLRRKRTRVRVLNGSNSRIYTLGRDDGAELLVIGSPAGARHEVACWPRAHPPDRAPSSSHVSIPWRPTTN
jgi:FtsP/CotA-like multicopper oxidase with cupredoxin domain